MSSSINYVADHIDRIDRRHGGKENLILDSKWRIASALEMFGSDLNPNGSLTPSQLAKVDAYIARFKSTPAGSDAICASQQRFAIAQYQRRAS
jgi:hypothetical protein